MKTFKIALLGTILIAGAAALAQPASAKDASRSNVMAACRHQSDCTIIANNKGGTIGCTDKVCFYCNSKSCHAIGARAGGGPKVIPNRGPEISMVESFGGSHSLGGSTSGGPSLSKAQISAVTANVSLH